MSKDLFRMRILAKIIMKSINNHIPLIGLSQLKDHCQLNIHTVIFILIYDTIQNNYLSILHQLRVCFYTYITFICFN